MEHTLVILAAGASSRMKKSVDAPLATNESNSGSKALIQFGKDNRPFLDYLLLNAQKAGYRDIILVIGKNSQGFITYYENNASFRELNISFATQAIPTNRVKPLGTADAVLQAMEQFLELQKEIFSVCNADNLYSVSALSDLQKSTASNAFISYDRGGLDFSAERVTSFALVSLDSENYLLDIIEKPGADEVSNFKDRTGKLRVSMNLWKLNGSQMYWYLKDCPLHPQRDEKELPTAILNMVKENPRSVLGIPRKEHVPDLTSKEDIAILKKYIEAHFPE
ncbi:glucose-1-phosphate adenylyltransferase [Ulvibacter sp. MAR_2010_11]|uniref:sugar phosphate nucleotidyltransferase n=1 Tax=Ulvibacter sp. MAR_2010_11 TaxID=1250229 RepID=UPI000C2C5345|nr:sugar phosphate nucleotidyltransferase [Ulvibacter sp. MAR_2010_11]PKA82057.1 glucose-1-phosphate adenylyltransferase [Ulvibacter sp. MAR_2010_11]